MEATYMGARQPGAGNNAAIAGRPALARQLSGGASMPSSLALGHVPWHVPPQQGPNATPMSPPRFGRRASPPANESIGSPASRTAGLQQLKQAATTRLTSRIPSPTTGAIAASGNEYVPSMGAQAPARAIIPNGVLPSHIPKPLPTGSQQPPPQQQQQQHQQARLPGTGPVGAPQGPVAPKPMATGPQRSVPSMPSSAAAAPMQGGATASAMQGPRPQVPGQLQQQAAAARALPGPGQPLPQQQQQQQVRMQPGSAMGAQVPRQQQAPSPKQRAPSPANRAPSPSQRTALAQQPPPPSGPPAQAAGQLQAARPGMMQQQQQQQQPGIIRQDAPMQAQLQPQPGTRAPIQQRPAPFPQQHHQYQHQQHQHQQHQQQYQQQHQQQAAAAPQAGGARAAAVPRPRSGSSGPPAAPSTAPIASNNRAAALAALAQRKQAAQQQQQQQQQQLQQPGLQQRPSAAAPPHQPPQQLGQPSPQQHQKPAVQQPQQQVQPASWQQQPQQQQHYQQQPSPGGLYATAAFPPGALPPEQDEYATEPMVQCHCCGRSFNEKAYAKHAKVCDKVFGQKRKVFNMVAARVAGTEAAKYVDVKKGVPKADTKPAGVAGQGAGATAAATAGAAAAAASKKAKWKAQSEQLRAAMRANRMMAEAQARGEDIRNLHFDTGPQPDDDRVPCPHCGRKFAALTAERHIPHCKNTVAKPKFQAAHGGMGAHNRRAMVKRY